MTKELIHGARFSCECGLRIVFMHRSFAVGHAVSHKNRCSYRGEVKPLSFTKPSEDLIYPDGSVEDGDAS